MTRRGAPAPAGVEPRSDAADRGSATVWAAITVAALVAVLSAVLGLVGAVGGRHRAEAAADLAALAAAGQAVRGEAVACRRAGDVAAGTGGRVVLCRVRGAEAVVEVDVTLRATVFGAVTARARARAGPASEMPALITPSGRLDRLSGRPSERNGTQVETITSRRTEMPPPRVHRCHRADRRPSLAWRAATGPTGAARRFGTRRTSDHDVAPQSAVGSARPPDAHPRPAPPRRGRRRPARPPTGRPAVAEDPPGDRDSPTKGRSSPRAPRRAPSPHRPCRAGRCRCRTWATARTTGSRPDTRSRRSPRGWP